jgi:hypothetical protein
LRSKVLAFLGLKPPTPSTGSLWFGFWSTFGALIRTCWTFVLCPVHALDIDS